MDIADVTRASATAMTEPTAADLGRQDFLRMLIAQLENQDPLNPQESTEFSSQLAQFSSLEQEIAMRTALDQIATVLTGGDKSTAIDLIGRDIVAETSQFELKDGGKVLHYELAGSSEETVLNIRDRNGAVVYSEDLGPQSAGRSEVSWNGIGRDGISLAEGIYSFEVVATSGFLPVSSTSLIDGRITGADVSGGSPMLRIGEIVVPLNGIREVRNGGAQDGATPR